VKAGTGCLLHGSSVSRHADQCRPCPATRWITPRPGPASPFVLAGYGDPAALSGLDGHGAHPSYRRV